MTCDGTDCPQGKKAYLPLNFTQPFVRKLQLDYHRFVRPWLASLLHSGLLRDLLFEQEQRFFSRALRELDLRRVGDTWRSYGYPAPILLSDLLRERVGMKVAWCKGKRNELLTNLKNQVQAKRRASSRGDPTKALLTDISDALAKQLREDFLDRGVAVIEKMGLNFELLRLAVLQEEEPRTPSMRPLHFCTFEMFRSHFPIIP